MEEVATTMAKPNMPQVTRDIQCDVEKAERGILDAKTALLRCGVSHSLCTPVSWSTRWGGSSTYRAWNRACTEPFGYIRLYQ